MPIESFVVCAKCGYRQQQNVALDPKQYRGFITVGLVYSLGAREILCYQLTTNSAPVIYCKTCAEELGFIIKKDYKQSDPVPVPIPKNQVESLLSELIRLAIIPEIKEMVGEHE